MSPLAGVLAAVAGLMMVAGAAVAGLLFGGLLSVGLWLRVPRTGGPTGRFA